MAQLKFETALSRLEETVQSLEKGDLSLEESLKVFEEGIRLSKNCIKMLSEAEMKVEMLIEGKEGKKRVRAFDPGKAGKPEGDVTPKGSSPGSSHG